MIKTRAAIAGVAALAALSGAAGVTYINADRGGVVTFEVAKYDRLLAQHQTVVIAGDCASSCTVGLGYPNVCLGPHASLRFHPGYDSILFGWLHYVLNPAATALMLSHYPPDARAVIDRHGDLTKDPGGWAFPRLFTVAGSEFPQHYQCTQVK